MPIFPIPSPLYQSTLIITIKTRYPINYNLKSHLHFMMEYVDNPIFFGHKYTNFILSSLTCINPIYSVTNLYNLFRYKTSTAMKNYPTIRIIANLVSSKAINFDFAKYMAYLNFGLLCTTSMIKKKHYTIKTAVLQILFL